MKIELTLDCNDLPAMSRFWEQALRCDSRPTVPGRYVSLTPPVLNGLTLTLQSVPERKEVKNRMHLDLLVADLETEAAHLCSLGATHVSPRMEDYGTRWYVMADPEGNEFCLAEEPAG
jgi:predicted enzyme related to lactoylglutathione lyase